MKPRRPTEREKHILDWKIFGKGISWARWCNMRGIKVRPDAPRGACTPRQRVLMHKGGQRATKA